MLIALRRLRSYVVVASRVWRDLKLRRLVVVVVVVVAEIMRSFLKRKVSRAFRFKY